MDTITITFTEVKIKVPIKDLTLRVTKKDMVKPVISLMRS